MSGCVNCGRRTPNDRCAACRQIQRNDDLHGEVTTGAVRVCRTCEGEFAPDEGEYSDDAPGVWRCFECRADEDPERTGVLKADGGTDRLKSLIRAREAGRCYLCDDDADVTRDATHRELGTVDVPLCWDHDAELDHDQNAGPNYPTPRSWGANNV